MEVGNALGARQGRAIPGGAGRGSGRAAPWFLCENSKFWALWELSYSPINYSFSLSSHSRAHGALSVAP